MSQPGGEPDLAALAERIDESVPPTAVEKSISLLGRWRAGIGLAALLLFCLGSLGYLFSPPAHKPVLSRSR